IVHVIGPELGLTLPGTVIVCGDSHTGTHGAFGAFALGIGTSEVEHVLATQCLRQFRPRTMEIRLTGVLQFGVTAKDAALGVLRTIGTAGATGHAVEYTGDLPHGFSMEQRMTLCNLTVEGGGRAGMVAPDDTTFAYLEQRPYAPHGADWEHALDAWRALAGDAGAQHQRTVVIDAASLEPTVTWGTTPAQSVPVTGRVPDPETFAAPVERAAAVRALAAMDPDVLLPGERCASTSNRNFEGRQGRGGRTHLVSPAMAAAAALHGHFVDVRRVASVEASA